MRSRAELLGRYDGVGGLGSEPPRSDFEPPTGAFLVAELEGRAVACGGICRYDERTAELRRMYVAPEARGNGVSRALLGELEQAARELGYSALRLETGDKQPEAIGLYSSAGFGAIARYGPYVDDPRSVCFEKELEMAYVPRPDEQVFEPPSWRPDDPARRIAELPRHIDRQHSRASLVALPPGTKGRRHREPRGARRRDRLGRSTSRRRRRRGHGRSAHCPGARR